MLKVNLKEELQKVDTPVYQPNEEKLLGEVKLILQNHDQAKREVLKDAGLDHLIKVSDSIQREKLEKNKIVMEWGKVYTTAEIQNLCLKYRLRFLESARYKGNIDVQLAQILLDFRKEKLNGAGYMRSSLYIMAPAASFNLDAKPIPPKSVDPAIFWKIDRDHYKLLHVWGDDFSRIRQIKGLILRDQTTYASTLFALSFIIISALFGGTFMGWGFIGVAVIAAIVTALAMLISGSASNGDFDFLTEKNWNSTTK